MMQYNIRYNQQERNGNRKNNKHGEMIAHHSPPCHHLSRVEEMMPEMLLMGVSNRCRPPTHTLRRCIQCSVPEGERTVHGTGQQKHPTAKILLETLEAKSGPPSGCDD